MKNLIALLLLAVATTVSAAEVPFKYDTNRFKAKQAPSNGEWRLIETSSAAEIVPANDLFPAGEFNLELGGTATIRNESRSKDDLNFGGSIGANYWFTRGLGLGIRAEAEDTAHSVVDRTLARASVRAPLWNTVAPYGYIEGGFDWEVDRWLAGAGGGLEWRPGPVLKGRLGLFAEAGLQVTTKGEGSMRGAVGIRLPLR